MTRHIRQPSLIGSDVSELYFAYGSNLWIEQVVERIGPIGEGAKRPMIATLPDHQLVFNMHADGQVFANLMSPGPGVLGVLYSFTAECLLKMDQYETGYAHRRVRVVLENGDEVEATTYHAEVVPAVALAPPSADYLQKILRGARQHGLPETYIKEIEARASAKTV